jgi:predicted DNA-binding transcriptional regulator AlpA
MDQLLTSWKDIATYLGKGVRTVQRWESQLGLPVRRPDSRKSKSMVVISTLEIDEWVASRTQPRAVRTLRKSELESLRTKVAELSAQNSIYQIELELLRARVGYERAAS